MLKHCDRIRSLRGTSALTVIAAAFAMTLPAQAQVAADSVAPADTAADNAGDPSIIVTGSRLRTTFNAPWF